MKHISIASVESLEKSQECFTLGNTHWTLVLASSDAGPSVRCTISFWRWRTTGIGRWHRTRASHCTRVRCCLTSASAEARVSDTESIRRPGSVRWECTDRVRYPCTLQSLCVLVRCAQDASGGLKVTVRDRRVSFKRVTHGCHLCTGRRVPASGGTCAARPVVPFSAQRKVNGSICLRGL